MLPDFNINAMCSLSRKLLALNINTFNDAIQYIHSLKYGRPSDADCSHSLILENKGTCSSKHLFLKRVIDGHNIKNIELTVGIYRMNEYNTPGVGTILNKYGLSYMPEAHSYLTFNAQRYDYTFANSKNQLWEQDLVKEKYFTTHHFSQEKVIFHKETLTNWIKEYALQYTLGEIWEIREACILQLTQQTYD